MSLQDRLRKFFVTHPSGRMMPRQPDDPGAQPTWFGPFVGPGTPITPVQGAVPPRYFDYISGVNANVIPRTEYPALPNFYQLWSAYESMPIIKAMVSFRIQEILSLDWKIRKREGSGVVSQVGVGAARKLLEHPDPQMDYGFEQWMRAILEEVYVSDALSIYPVRNKLKRVVGFMQVDGQTIKPLIDYERGGIPVDLIGEGDFAFNVTQTMLEIEVPDTYRFRIAGIGFGADNEANLRYITWSIIATPPGTPITGYNNKQAGIGSVLQPSWVFTTQGSSVKLSLIVTSSNFSINPMHIFARVQGWFYSEKLVGDKA